ncbi:MAG: MOSC domain-containing protein [Desulfovibrio sp.]|jgi:molybdenum cofactor synthesis domain-containing protein|nr:MOSC domain-containing protein [Desulfovibrio sp.]
MGAIVAICISEKKGIAKRPVPEALCVAHYGLENDAHAGSPRRQVSLLSLERIEDFRRKGAVAPFGCFGENIVVRGVDFAALPIGTRFACGNILLELTQIGKECHSRCRIFDSMGECIMPGQGVFAVVLRGGIIRTGDEMTVLLPENHAGEAAECSGRHMAFSQEAIPSGSAQVLSGQRPDSDSACPRSYTAAVLTLSDKGAAGQRVDESGRTILSILETHGYHVARYAVLPDEQSAISAELARLADAGGIDLVLTTGGTGFSKRDVTPEATLAVVTRQCPGIPEAMRTFSLAITRRAMLTRAAAGIRGETLIVNLPGSPRAVEECLNYILDELKHGLDILTGRDAECARRPEQ